MPELGLELLNLFGLCLLGGLLPVLLLGYLSLSILPPPLFDAGPPLFYELWGGQLPGWGDLPARRGRIRRWPLFFKF